MTTMRDKYGDLLLKTPDGWKYVDEYDYEPIERPCQDIRGWRNGPEDRPMWWDYDESDRENEDDD